MSVLGIAVGGGLSLRANTPVRWYDANEVGYLGLRAPAAVGSSALVYTLPLPPLVNGQVLSSNTAGVMSWVTPSAGGSGEVNTCSNVGTGSGVFKQKSGVNFEFKTVAAGTDAAGQRTVQVSAGTNEVVFGCWGLVPVGAVVAWLKSLPGVPQTLPDGFVECDGRTISDGASPLNGVTIPNLNGYPADFNHAFGVQRYLRGGLTSGQMTGSDTHTHGLPTSVSVCNGTGTPKSAVEAMSATSAASSHPPSYTVVWIMRVK